MKTSELQIYWRGRIQVKNVKWKFSPEREQFLSETLEKKVAEIWTETVDSYPGTYDGKILTLEDFCATENSISMDLGFIRFSRILTLDSMGASPQGYGSLGVQAALFSSDKMHLLVGQRPADVMYCPLFYGIPGGILEVIDTENDFEFACLREVREEVEIEINPEIEIVALMSELHGSVGVSAIISGIVADTIDIMEHVQGNEEWRDNKLSWYPVDSLSQFVSNNSLEGLLLVKDEWRRFQESGESIFW